MPEPDITILMSVYNSRRYLREAIESILHQTFKNFEFIIVDDRSTDGSLDILNEYAQKDPRIRLIKNEKNLGLTRSLNKSIKAATGKYIARMDSDDIADAERLEKQIGFMTKNPDVVLLGTAFHEIDQNGNVLASKAFPLDDNKLKHVLIKLNPFCHASVIIRRSALDMSGFYNEDMPKAQDYDLWFRLANAGKIANLPEPLIKRRYDKNISITQENEQLKWAIKIRRNAIKRGYCSPVNYIYLIRPFTALIMPVFLRKTIRKHILKNRMYG